VMDPVAGLFKNRANRGAYRGDTRWQNTRFTNGVPNMLDPGYTINETDTLPAVDSAQSLVFLGRRLAEDDRFAQKTVRTIFQGFTGIVETSAATTEYLRQLKLNFQASNYNLRTLVRDIHKGPYFLSQSLGSDVDPSQFQDVGNGRRLTPEELHRKISAVIDADYEWKGPETRSGLLGEYLLLYGGIDSVGITRRSSEANALSNGIQLRIANQISCERVAIDLSNGGLLFPIASVDDDPDSATGVDRIRRNIQFLHRHLLGEDLSMDDPEIENTLALFLDARAAGETNIPGACRGGGAATDANGTVIPWMAVLTYLLSDYRFFYQ